jgi:hypothetical protein
LVGLNPILPSLPQNYFYVEEDLKISGIRNLQSGKKLEGMEDSFGSQGP